MLSLNHYLIFENYFKDDLVSKNYKLLSNTKERSIYKIDDKTIIKIANNYDGIIQNLQESSSKFQSKFKDCVAKVIDKEFAGKWLKLQYARPVTKNEIVEKNSLFNKLNELKNSNTLNFGTIKYINYGLVKNKNFSTLILIDYGNPDQNLIKYLNNQI